MRYMGRLNNLNNLTELFRNQYSYEMLIKSCKKNNIDLDDFLNLFNYGLINNCEIIHKFFEKYGIMKFNIPLFFLKILNFIFPNLEIQNLN